MTTDGGIHILGTKPIHVVPALALLGIGVLLQSNFVKGAGFGMALVLLFNNMRAGAPRYRWRLKDAE